MILSPAQPAEAPVRSVALVVLGLASSGLSYAEVGDQLGLSEHTVKKIVVQLLRTWNCRNLAHAVATAVAAGYLTPGKDPMPTTFSHQQGKFTVTGRDGDYLITHAGSTLVAGRAKSHPEVARLLKNLNAIADKLAGRAN